MEAAVHAFQSVLTSTQVPPRAQARPETVLLSRHAGCERKRSSRSVTKGNSVFLDSSFRTAVPSHVITQVIKIFPEHGDRMGLGLFLLLPNPNIGGRKPIELFEIKPGPCGISS